MSSKYVFNAKPSSFRPSRDEGYQAYDARLTKMAVTLIEGLAAPETIGDQIATWRTEMALSFHLGSDWNIMKSINDSVRHIFDRERHDIESSDLLFLCCKSVRAWTEYISLTSFGAYSWGKEHPSNRLRSGALPIGDNLYVVTQQLTAIASMSAFLLKYKNDLASHSNLFFHKNPSINIPLNLSSLSRMEKYAPLLSLGLDSYINGSVQSLMSLITCLCSSVVDAVSGAGKSYMYGMFGIESFDAYPPMYAIYDQATKEDPKWFTQSSNPIMDRVHRGQVDEIIDALYARTSICGGQLCHIPIITAFPKVNIGEIFYSDVSDSYISNIPLSVKLAEAIINSHAVNNSIPVQNGNSRSQFANFGFNMTVSVAPEQVITYNMTQKGLKNMNQPSSKESIEHSIAAQIENVKYALIYGFKVVAFPQFNLVNA